MVLKHDFYLMYQFFTRAQNILLPVQPEIVHKKIHCLKLNG